MKWAIVLSALVFAGSANAASLWPAADSLASGVAGTAVQMRCVTQQEWETDPLRDPNSREAAYSIPEWGYAVLPPWVCGPVILLIADPNAQVIHGYTRDEGRNLFIFLHETEHLAGFLSERDADCKAIAIFPSVVRQLGVKPKRAMTLLQWAKQTVRFSC